MPAERTAHLIGMLLGVSVSPGLVDKAASRLDGRLRDAGFDAAMQAALAAEPALGADETLVNVRVDSRLRTLNTFWLLMIVLNLFATACG